MRMKKFLTFLLTLAMVVSLLPASAFAANNTATTMRLAKTQGTVAVTNATGKAVTQTSNMKLYNGYKIKTGAKSYAWISLDDTKAAKLDANSVVSVQKSGQKLTLYLSSGNIFFNVKEKLSGGESFHIKTSTMTTGIRGTSGCVRVINPRVTEIHLLTGQIEVYTENPELHISKTAVLTAGQKATSLIAADAMAATGEQADIIIEQLTHREVCGNCSMEIAADPALVERIKEEAPHLLPEEIADDAENRLAADEQAAAEKQAAIDQAVERQELPEDVDPYFEKEETTSGGGGGGSSAPPAVPAPVTEVNVSTWPELVKAIDDYNTEGVIRKINLAADITGTNVDDALGIITDNGPLTLNLDQYTLKTNGTLINNGDLTITNADGHLIGPGNAEAVRNNNLLTLEDGEIDGNGAAALVNNADFTMNGGEIVGETGISMLGGTAVLLGGTITADAAGAAGVAVRGGNLTLNGTEIEALSGMGMRLAGGMTHFVSGMVSAQLNADAVAADADTYFDSNITATIRGMDPNKVFGVQPGGALPAGYSLLDDTANSGYYILTEGVAAPAEGWEEFIAQIEEFNSGTESKTIVLNEEIDLTGTGASLPVIADNGATLTINLNGNTLTLTDALTNNGSLTISDTAAGGSITGTAEPLISNTGDFTLAGGTLTPAGDAVYSTGGSVTMTDGAITVNDAAAGGIHTENTELNLTGGTITSTAAGGAAVTVTGGTVNTPVTTTVKAVTEADVWSGTLPSGYTVEAEAGTGNYVLTEEPAPAGITTWAQFVAAVDAFNAGTADKTITLAAAIPAASETGTLETLDPIADNGATLTIDLNGFALTLPQTMTNTGDLVITGGGTISADYTAVTTLIQNNGGTVELADATLNLSMNQTGIANAAGTVNMTGGLMNLNNVPSYGIMSDNGTVNMTGGEIVLVGCGSSSTNYGIYGANTDITIDGGTVREGDGIVNASADINYAVYAEGGSLLLESGTIKAHNGYAVGVDDVADLTLTGAVVLAKKGDNLLTAANSSETGYTFSDYDGTYFKLEKETPDDGINTWEEFVAAIAAFNAGGDAVITLTEDLDPTAAMLAAYPMPSIDTARTLEINLNGNTLALPVTLEGNLALENGTVTTGEQWNPEMMVLLSGELDLDDVNIYSDDIYYALIDAQTNVTLDNVEMTVVIREYDSETTPYVGGYGIVNNAGTGVTMNSGTITVESGMAVDCYYGVFIMEGGTIDVENGAGVFVDGTNAAGAALNGGTIMVSGSGTSVDVASAESPGVTVTESMVIKAKDPSGVYTPAGYTVTTTPDEEGYYYMIPAAAAVPMEVSDWEGFVNAVNAFNLGTSAETITLLADIEATEEEALAYPLDGIGNGNSSDLTIDLGTYTLALPTMLETVSSSGLIIDGTGTITTGQAWNGGDYLINNSTELTINSANITGDAYCLVNNTGTLTWDEASMTISTANGVGLTTSNMAEVGNGSQNSSTLFDVTGSEATAIIVADGELTLDHMQIETAANMDQLAIRVEAGELIVDGATIYVETGNTGINNMDSATLNSISMSARNGNTGTLIVNTGDLTLDDGSLVTDIGAAVDMSAGTFTMTDGDIRTTSYYYAALRMTGGEATLEGGSITANNNGGGEMAVTVSNAVLNLDGATVTANGADTTGIRASNSGELNLFSGTVTAENATAVAVYADAANATVTFDGTAEIRAKAEENVLSPDATAFGFYTEDGGDDYFYLAAAAGTPVIEVTNETEFAAAVAGLTDGDVQIILMGDVTLSTEYEFGDGVTNVGALDINLNGNDLILQSTLYNNTGLYIYDSTGGGSVYSADGYTVSELINNSGTLVWENAEIILQDGQWGIFTSGELTMNSGSVTAPETTTYATYGVLYQAAAADRTNVSAAAITVTGDVVLVEQAAE